MSICKKIAIPRNEEEFVHSALELFRFQYEHCLPYREYVDALGISPEGVERVSEIPFLPIGAFKRRAVYCDDLRGVPPATIFTSSGTTGMIPSKHYVRDLDLYEQSFRRGFELFYGAPGEVVILALLPGYLEREGSSLIYMVDRLVSDNRDSGFFLRDHDELIHRIQRAQGARKKVLLLGVSYALWELAETNQLPHSDLIVMETGGMKGHRRELPREELHAILCQGLGVDRIHSEYGMTELLSQAYSAGAGIFRTPPWMRVLAREANDPTCLIDPGGVGGLNIIDLANVYSCAFIQTEDLGICFSDGSFRVLGRQDGSDLRGCNMLVQ